MCRLSSDVSLLSKNQVMESLILLGCSVHKHTAELIVLLVDLYTLQDLASDVCHVLYEIDNLQAVK